MINKNEKQGALKTIKMGYGPHLMADLEKADFMRLNDFELCLRFLNEMPGIIGMTKIHGPDVLRYQPELDIDEHGITGTVIIAESHISIHTYPYRRYAFIDIFSCKPFDTELALDSICVFFKTTREDIHAQITYRGRNFPRHA